jgi:hypothetical protein
MEVAPTFYVAESDALHGIGIDPLLKRIIKSQDIQYPLYLRGNPPVGTCTICVGKKEIGWREHFGVVRSLESDIFYQGE